MPSQRHVHWADNPLYTVEYLPVHHLLLSHLSDSPPTPYHADWTGAANAGGPTGMHYDSPRTHSTLEPTVCLDQPLSQGHRTLIEEGGRSIFPIIEGTVTGKLLGLLYFKYKLCTVEPILKDHPTNHKNGAFLARWFLVTGSFTLKCRTFCQKYLIFQDSHDSGLSRQVTLYIDKCGFHHLFIFMAFLSRNR